jgi:hypothetical protein
MAPLAPKRYVRRREVRLEGIVTAWQRPVRLLALILCLIAFGCSGPGATYYQSPSGQSGLTHGSSEGGGGEGGM